MRIEKLPIATLKLPPYNPRQDLRPGDLAYEKIARSLAEWGLVEPLVWNERTGHLVGGHQRLKVLIAQGETEVEVSVVNLDDRAEQALALALNKVGGDWDEGQLRALLAELDDGTYDPTISGFDREEIDQLLMPEEPEDLDTLLEELDLGAAIERPIWAVVRTGTENREVLERALRVLEGRGIKVERSYA